MPYKIKKVLKQAQPTATEISTIYKDNDQEIVMAFGSPDRQVLVLDYRESLEQSKPIGKEFLSNLAGPIIMKLIDINKVFRCRGY